MQRLFFPACVRLNLFCLSFQWIEVKGRPAPRHEAPIVVSNHQARTRPAADATRATRPPTQRRRRGAPPQGFPDIWWFIWQFLPVGVSAAENMRFPVMGDIMLSQQARRRRRCRTCIRP